VLPLSKTAVTHCIADDVAHLARPVRQISEDDGRQLADPDGQQTSVENERIGNGHHHQEEVRGELQHSFVSENDEGEDVAESAEEDDERRNVELQQLMSSVLAQLGHLLHRYLLHDTTHKLPRSTYVRYARHHKSIFRLSSVTFVHHTQMVEFFNKIFAPRRFVA